MRILFLITLIFLLFSGVGWAQAGPDFGACAPEVNALSWQTNSENDMDHYEIYQSFEGTEDLLDVSAKTPFVANVPHLAGRPSTLWKMTEPPMKEGKSYYAVLAVDKGGLKSPPSAAISCLYNRSPNRVEGLAVE